ncbi:MAG: hypothetical protein AB7O57_09150, partial [Hyphomicrobiaceae bacterium]
MEGAATDLAARGRGVKCRRQPSVATTTRIGDYHHETDGERGEAAKIARMALDPTQLPDDVAALKAMLIAADARASEAEARANDLDAEIETPKLTIAKLKRDRFGPSSERAQLLDQLELQLGE